MGEIDSRLLGLLSKMGSELEKRAREHRRVQPYYDGPCPIPPAIQKARLTRSYMALREMSEIPWGSIPVDAVQDRMEPIGIESPDKDASDKVWGAWQEAGLDAEFKLALTSILVDGRAFLTSWRQKGQAWPEIVADDASHMIVMYADGSRTKAIAALRYWVEDDRPYATLYLADGLYKFVGPKNSSGFSGTRWEKRIVPGEEWPVHNPWNVVPVSELAINRRLSTGPFPAARGEYAPYTGLIDRINLLTYLGMIVALWMGFPLRGVIGHEITQDDEGNDIPPFNADADSVFVLENPDAKIVEYQAASRENLAIVPELAQFAYLTKTPPYYFPAQSLANIAADTVRALDGGLIAKTTGHKASIGEGLERTLRIAGLMLDDPVQLSQRAEMQWRNSEFRSLAERADAATKLKDVMPWQFIGEYVLGLSHDQINRFSSMRAADGLNQLLASVTTPPQLPTGVS